MTLPPDRLEMENDLGLGPHGFTGVVARCPFGYPAVVETAPVLRGGAPDASPWYLTCPALAEVVGRAEEAGVVEELETAVGTDGPLHHLLLEVGRLHQEGRTDRRVNELQVNTGTPRLGAGMGAPEGPELACCLHAYAAALLAVLGGWLDTSGKGQGQLALQARTAWGEFLPPLEECWCRNGRCSKWDTGQRRGVIDVGAISVRLLVADVINGRPWTVLERAEATRLGEGLVAGGTLTSAARRRTAEAITRFAHEARSCGVDSLLLAATHAARQASDGESFIYDVGQENALSTVVLTERREAELTYAGVSLDGIAQAIVLYVGGTGSAVIAQFDPGMVEAVSLELGASQATETWINSDPPSVRETASIYYEAAKVFHDLRPRFGAKASGARLVGVAGTITTLACLDGGLEGHNSDALYGRELSLCSVRTLVACLSAMTTEERAGLPGMQAGRAPVILGGAVIVQAAMETLGYESLLVSEHDLLDGLVLRGAPPPA